MHVTSRPARRRAALAAVLVPALMLAAAACGKQGAGGTSYVGADPVEVARAAGCEAPTAATQAPASAPVQYRRILCALDKRAVSIQTYPSAEQQAAAEDDAIPALGRSLPKGTYYYASGNGWLAEDASNFSKAIAQTLADKLDGSVRSFEGGTG